MTHTYLTTTKHQINYDRHVSHHHETSHKLWRSHISPPRKHYINDDVTYLTTTKTSHKWWRFHTFHLRETSYQWWRLRVSPLWIIIKYHNLPPPRRGSHVNSDNTHTIINIHPLANILDISALIFSSCALFTVFPTSIM